MPGPRPAPELARYDTINAERAGQSAPPTEPAPPGTALGVLSAVLSNDGQQISATQTRNQALSDADHLAVLHAIWTAETTPARNQHYRDLLMNALPPGHRAEPGHQARWLWRTLRAAELAGLGPARVLAEALAERDLAGSRDVPAVIDARIRCRLGSVIPLPPGSWSAQVPAIADPGRRAYAEQIAALMDARKDRIGEHAAEHALPWAINALGPVPEDPVDRLDWQQRAASIGAWRELSGYDHPTDSIGPEPTAAAPDKRAAWYEPWPTSAPSTGPTSAACPTAGCCTCATPTPSRPPGPRSGSATSSARSAPTPAKPSWPRPAPTGKPPPAPSAIWPWPPTPNCAAGIRSSGLPRSVRPNHRPPRRPARRDPDRRAGHPGCGPVDQGPCRRAPEVRRPAGRPAEPDDSRRRPRLRRPRPGLPRLDRLLPRGDPAAAETTDPSPGPRPGARRGPRGRHRSWGMTVARCILDAKGRPRLLRG